MAQLRIHILLASTFLSIAARNLPTHLALRGGDLVSSEEERALYALGCNVGRQVGDLDCFAPDEIDTILRGLKDTLLRRELKENLLDAMPKAAALFKERQAAHLAKIEAEGSAALAAAAAEEGAITTNSGLVVKMLEVGEGVSPAATDTVRVHYTGRLYSTSGDVFDSTVQRGEPAEFPLAAVVKGWQEGLQMMKTGGKAILTLPADLGYGDEGKSIIPPKAVLSFEVELLSVIESKRGAKEDDVLE